MLPDTVVDSTAAIRGITPQKAGAALTRLPLTPPRAGAAALHLQILLDRANFSPGVLTGAWNDNARRALQWFQAANGLDSSGVVDQATYTKLTGSAGDRPLFVQYAVTDADLRGPFVTIPANVYAKAKLRCLCYQSAGEELAERFHVTQSLLRQLNPHTRLTALRSGTSLWVPNVARDSAAPAPYTTARIVISRTEFWTNALDSSGHVVAHYPSTLGSEYDPSPTGDFSVVRVSANPRYHYQPTLYAEVPDTKPTTYLPAGPNSPVGIVWMALSAPHYGIHGTSDPSTIGLTESHGCVRLTNWDAWTLSKSVQPGVPVTFQ